MRVAKLIASGQEVGKTSDYQIPVNLHLVDTFMSLARVTKREMFSFLRNGTSYRGDIKRKNEDKDAIM